MAEAEPTTHTMPSITMEMSLVVVAKLVPVRVIEVPPTLGPNLGVMLVITDVAASEYVILLAKI